MKQYDVLILTPATLRPEIYSRTLESFFENCFYQDGYYEDKFRLHLALHIDCVGKETTHSDEVVNVAQDYFDHIPFLQKNHILEQASLSNAFHTLWRFASDYCCDFYFYLEDDWVMNKRISLMRMIKIMEFSPTLATLRLNFKPSDKESTKQWKHYFRWEGLYFKCPEEDKKHIGWCGHPNIVRGEFIRETAELLSPFFCPEKQMKGLWNSGRWGVMMRDIIEKWDYGVCSVPLSDPVISDIGRAWRAENQIIKDDINTMWRRRPDEV